MLRLGRQESFCSNTRGQSTFQFFARKQALRRSASSMQKGNNLARNSTEHERPILCL